MYVSVLVCVCIGWYRYGPMPRPFHLCLLCINCISVSIQFEGTLRGEMVPSHRDPNRRYLLAPVTYVIFLSQTRIVNGKHDFPFARFSFELQMSIRVCVSVCVYVCQTIYVCTNTI